MLITSPVDPPACPLHHRALPPADRGHEPERGSSPHPPQDRRQRLTMPGGARFPVPDLVRRRADVGRRARPRLARFARRHAVRASNTTGASPSARPCPAAAPPSSPRPPTPMARSSSSSSARPASRSGGDEARCPARLPPARATSRLIRHDAAAPRHAARTARRPASTALTLPYREQDRHHVRHPAPGLDAGARGIAPILTGADKANSLADGDAAPVVRRSVSRAPRRSSTPP